MEQQQRQPSMTAMTGSSSIQGNIEIIVILFLWTMPQQQRPTRRSMGYSSQLWMVLSLDEIMDDDDDVDVLGKFVFRA